MQIRVAMISCAAASLGVAAELRASFNGLGSIKIGSTVTELEHVLGRAIPIPGDPEEAACFVVPGDARSTYSAMVAEGHVARIDVDTPAIPTLRGARVGDTIDQVRKLYGATLEEAPHFYGDRSDLYLTYWSKDRAFALRFETAGGNISRFYIGRAREVQFVEGCQ